MVFKAVGGVDKDVYDVYKSDQTFSENKEEALNVRSDHKDHYKNRIILNWKTFHPSEVLCNEQHSPFLDKWKKRVFSKMISLFYKLLTQDQG